MSSFTKLFKSKEELEKLKELEENKKRALNEYKYQLNEVKKSGKITQNNYSKKLASFEELINMEAKRKNKLLNQSYELNKEKYNKLLNNTQLFRTKKAVTFNIPSEKVNISKHQQKSSLVGNKFNEPPIVERNIISNLINKLPETYSKLYKKVVSKQYYGMNEYVKNPNMMIKFKKYVINSTIPIESNNELKKKEKEKIRELINSYNKNKQLTEDNKKTILTYIASKYYKFNNTK